MAIAASGADATGSGGPVGRGGGAALISASSSLVSGHGAVVAVDDAASESDDAADDERATGCIGTPEQNGQSQRRRKAVIGGRWQSWWHP